MLAVPIFIMQIRRVWIFYAQLVHIGHWDSKKSINCMQVGKFRHSPSKILIFYIILFCHSSHSQWLLFIIFLFSLNSISLTKIRLYNTQDTHVCEHHAPGNMNGEKNPLTHESESEIFPCEKSSVPSNTYLNVCSDVQIFILSFLDSLFDSQKEFFCF